MDKYVCEKCNKEIQGTTCRYCGYIKDEGMTIYELRAKNRI